MSSNVPAEVEIQRKYYAGTAGRYNEMHVREKDAHYFALSLMVATLDYFNIKSILEIGSGTGRAVSYVKNKCPEIRIVGVEPVKELREIGYKQGLSHEELVAGNALNLKFNNGEFDMVCAFGMLHHIRTPEIAVAEMLRVAKKTLFISDANNFGQGSLIVRSIKQLINLFGLWKIADLIKTKGKGYTILKGDGLVYSYSIFTNYKQIEQECKSIHLLNTGEGGINLYRTASQVALLGLKK
ncbi:MAG: class I SAM-dependent methyltransferase [PVC group bacterium]